MKSYFAKMRGEMLSPPRPANGHIFWSWLGSLFGIAATAYLAHVSKVPLFMAPFGGSAVLAFAVPESPLSQPRNIIGGHVLATSVGLVFVTFLGTSWWWMALAVATTIALMQITKTLHAPAGADPLVVMTAHASWDFVLTPALSGSIILVFIALVFNNLVSNRSYPKYWR
jgi:CBS-domain-containing membrane protein